MLLDLPVLDASAVARLAPSDLREYVALHEEAAARRLRRKFFSFYPDTGPLRRELYKKHVEFFRAGAIHDERLMMAANKVGKTEGVGAFEMAAHVTGRYPAWWPGRKFTGVGEWWAAGKTNESTRDIVQANLFGKTKMWPSGRKYFDGTGLIPGDDIGQCQWKRGSNLLDVAEVRHHDAAGQPDGWSIVGIKSYEQGRGSFEGTNKRGIWLDEEPELAIYTECLLRTMTANGIMILTFTPLEGLSETVLSFCPGGAIPEQEPV